MNNKIDLEELKRLTEEARVATQKRKEQADLYEKEQQERQRLIQEEKDKQEAQRIIENISALASRAAKYGENNVIVYELKGSSTLSDVVGKLVFNYCQENNLSPRIVQTGSITSDTYYEGWGYDTTYFYGIQISW